MGEAVAICAKCGRKFITLPRGAMIDAYRRHGCADKCGGELKLVQHSSGKIDDQNA